MTCRGRRSRPTGQAESARQTQQLQAKAFAIAPPHLALPNNFTRRPGGRNVHELIPALESRGIEMSRARGKRAAADEMEEVIATPEDEMEEAVAPPEGGSGR